MNDESMSGKAFDIDDEHGCAHASTPFALSLGITLAEPRRPPEAAKTQHSPRRPCVAQPMVQSHACAISAGQWAVCGRKAPLTEVAARALEGLDFPAGTARLHQAPVMLSVTGTRATGRCTAPPAFRHSRTNRGRIALTSRATTLTHQARASHAATAGTNRLSLVHVRRRLLATRFRSGERPTSAAAVLRQQKRSTARAPQRIGRPKKLTQDHGARQNHR
jgi:hypothetical protein